MIRTVGRFNDILLHTAYTVSAVTTCSSVSKEPH